MPTSTTPASSSRRISRLRPTAVCSTMNRSKTSPAASTMQVAWSSWAQSTPAQTRADASIGGDTHLGFLTVGAVGSQPVVPGPRSRSLTDRRSPAYSPVAGLGVLGHRTPQNSCWTSKVERTWRWPGGDLGCISGLSDGRLLFNVLTMVAEFSDLIRLRTVEGMKVAKAKGGCAASSPSSTRNRKRTWSRWCTAASTAPSRSPSSSESAAPRSTAPSNADVQPRRPTSRGRA